MQQKEILTKRKKKKKTPFVRKTSIPKMYRPSLSDFHHHLCQSVHKAPTTNCSYYFRFVQLPPLHSLFYFTPFQIIQFICGVVNEVVNLWCGWIRADIYKIQNTRSFFFLLHNPINKNISWNFVGCLREVLLKFFFLFEGGYYIVC